jgi:hypothetical protein
VYVSIRHSMMEVLSDSTGLFPLSQFRASVGNFAFTICELTAIWIVYLIQHPIGLYVSFNLNMTSLHLAKKFRLTLALDQVSYRRIERKCGSLFLSATCMKGNP